MSLIPSESINNNTAEFMKPAPLFDNGRSLLYDATAYDLQHIESYIKRLKGYMLPFDTQAKLFVDKRHLPGLRKLTAFTFKNHPKYPMDESTLNLLSAFIQKRARAILELYRVREEARSI